MHSKVKKLVEWQVNKHDRILTSQTADTDGSGKSTACLTVDKNTFEIEKALFTRKTGETIELDTIAGIEAYIKGKGPIKNLLKGILDKEETGLVIQCISALVQAETYVYEERGYKSKDEYNVYWDMLEKNGCRYYSDSRKQMRVSEPEWMDYVPDLFNSDIIFKRSKEYELEDLGDSIVITGVLGDTYHGMHVQITTDRDFVIKNMDIKVLRGPGKACFTNNENKSRLLEFNFRNMDRKSIVDNLGKCNGCYHIVEMVLDMQSIAASLGKSEISA